MGERVGTWIFPQRWRLLRRSGWNRAVRAGKVRVHLLDPSTHVGPRSYIGPTALLPDGRSHLDRTAETVIELVRASCTATADAGPANTLTPDQATGGQRALRAAGASVTASVPRSASCKRWPTSTPIITPARESADGSAGSAAVFWCRLMTSASSVLRVESIWPKATPIRGLLSASDHAWTPIPASPLPWFFAVMSSTAAARTVPIDSPERSSVTVRINSDQISSPALRAVDKAIASWRAARM